MELGLIYKNMFKAIKISASIDINNWDKDGFFTEIEAWKHVIDNFLCKECKKLVKKGEHPSSTACGLEWIVEEYE